MAFAKGIAAEYVLFCTHKRVPERTAVPVGHESPGGAFKPQTGLRSKCCVFSTARSQRFQRAGSMKKGLLALDNPKVERLHTKNPSRCARGFFVFRRLIGPSAAAAAAPRRGADLRLMLALSAACRCGPPREKANQENPQIFLICKYKNNFSAIISQSERGGNSKSLLLSLYKSPALC